MSLHYLVKLEMFIAHMLPLSCYRKKHQNLSKLNLEYLTVEKYSLHKLNNWSVARVGMLMVLVVACDRKAEPEEF